MLAGVCHDFFFFQAEDGIRDYKVTGVQTCALPISVIGVIGALVLAAASGSLSWRTFEASVMGATKTSCMIAFILAGAAFLTVAMAFTGVPRIMAQWIGDQGFADWIRISALQ